MSQSMSFTPNSIGGEYKHQLTIQELPKHQHYENLMAKGFDGWNEITVKLHGLIFDYNSNSYTYPDTKVHATPVEAYTHTSFTGDSASHNNIQPYVITYFWKRTN